MNQLMYQPALVKPAITRKGENKSFQQAPIVLFFLMLRKNYPAKC